MQSLDLQGYGIYDCYPIAAIFAAARQRVVKSRASPKVIISGSSGLVGRALSFFLERMGYEVLPFIRGTPSSLLLKEWEGSEAFIHLAGAGIADKTWSAARKQELYDSRVNLTRSVVSLLLRLKQPPRVFLSASAVGYYGNRKEELLTESASLGTGFLAELCEQWEKASLLLLSRNIRVIHARFGVVLSEQGGMLSKMIPMYKWGLGGVLGDGNQFLSWIDLSDLIRAIFFCLNFPQIRGAVNMVSPNPIRQKEFAHTLAHLLYRPCLLPLPRRLMRLFLGEMADEVLFTSQKVVPDKLLKAGFSFQYPDLSACLTEILFHPTSR